jgi:hypothetical protein
VRTAVFETLKANGMRDGVHIRLTLTRGEKVTSGMSPTNNQSGPSLIVLAEWKGLVDSSGKVVGGLSPQTLITSSIRRNTPACLDSKIHHCNLLNNILAKIQANMARADDALMLDVHGFVSETNATNFFIVKRGVLITPHADACLPGITRGMVIEIARELGIKVPSAPTSGSFLRAPRIPRRSCLVRICPPTASRVFTWGLLYCCQSRCLSARGQVEERNVSLAEVRPALLAAHPECGAMWVAARTGPSAAGAPTS